VNLTISHDNDFDFKLKHACEEPWAKYDLKQDRHTHLSESLDPMLVAVRSVSAGRFFMGVDDSGPSYLKKIAHFNTAGKC